MSEIPEVFAMFEQKLAHVLSFTIIAQRNNTKQAIEELLAYFSGIVERASKAEARIAELEAESERFTVHSDIERQDDKSPNDTQTQTIVYGKEREE